nr:PREDICTED: uncharacterized protein LOC109033425 [Bemisia tabaci]
MAGKEENQEPEKKDKSVQTTKNWETPRRNYEPGSKRRRLSSDKTESIEPEATTTTSMKHDDIFNEFMTVMNDPLLDLNDSCSAHKELKLDFHNFRPRRVMELLVDRASSTNTSPKEFFEEMRRIIHSRFGEGEGESDELDDTSVDRLEGKYSITETGNAPDVITPSRLCFTFPQFAVAVKRNSIVHKIRSLQMEYSPRFIDILPLFYLPEFGGLIPSRNTLEKEVWEALITLHVYAMYKLNQPEPFQNPVSVYARQMLLKRGIATGLLSNEQRLYYLLHNKVIVSDRELSYSAEKAYRELLQSKSSFTRQINFNLIDY